MSKEATISKTETLALTEQYCNGTLPCGFYYFTNGKEVYPIHHQQVKGLTAVRGVEVVAEVPTYEEYLKLESDSLAKQEGVEIVAELEDRLKEAEGVVKAIHYGIEKGFTTCDCCGYENRCSDCYYNDVAKEYLEKYGVKK